MKADLVAFDPAPCATRRHSEAMAYPEGIPYVVVNGKLVLDAASGPSIARAPALHSP